MNNGESRRIARDIDIEGVRAFNQGDLVVVQGTSPHPQRPQFKHLVFSPALGKTFLLRDEDLIQPQVPPQPVAQAPAPYLAPGDASPQPGVMPPPTQQQYISPSDAHARPAEYRQAYAPAPRAVGAKRSSRDESLLQWYSGALVVLGVLIVISTFLPWLTFLGLSGGSGWNAMLHGGSGGGFSVYLSGEGVKFFTGFWSLLVGVAVVTGGGLFFYRNRVGVWVANIAGFLGVLCSWLTTMTIITHGMSAGIGLWMFNLLSLATVIVSAVTIRKFR